jgi:hypothetical protein
VTTRQLIVAALVLGLVCCAVMWMLEGFRQEQILAAFRAEWAGVPTHLRGDDAA